jgi:PhnB protein
MMRTPASLMKESPMARVNTFLNFQGQTEEAFTFYSKIFGNEVTMLSRFSDMPAASLENCPPKSWTS